MTCRRWQTHAMQTSGRSSHKARGQQQTPVYGAQASKHQWPDGGKCVTMGSFTTAIIHPRVRARRTRNTPARPARRSAWYMPASALRLSATCPLWRGLRIIVSHRRNTGMPRGREPKLMLFLRAYLPSPTAFSRGHHRPEAHRSPVPSTQQ
jgi:hypothetical protein